ncbi:DNA helicase RecQ [Zooshikella ganghwensis]|uniref:DNA helicase RecQ n=1 Tax=Zooshikella ganghwensis TaxID=202772 RepID=A0A4P9VWQ5_9GAMM|nr:DNA helicase RecQ [Zooshikella ganghwensis]RDH46330.1 DNA helicase RecQ [Zooshikella ganghwensis]
MIEQAQHVLKHVFGYDNFRPLQQEVITNIVSGKDTLVIMPTGGGKSLCYQIPALLFSGITIVVSPLISLMKDQVEQLKQLGVSAVFLNSSLSVQEYQHNIDMILRKDVKLIYLAPETLLQRKILSLLSTIDIACITIDEAHCISEWGHEFRPEYRQLLQLRSIFPHAIYVALTATATPQVQKDICNNLNLDTQNTFIASFDRTNLYLQVLPKKSPLQQTAQFLDSFKQQSGIIYCLTRRQVDELTAHLHYQGYSVLPYHAGLSDEERAANQDRFIRDDVSIIVATVAFGMGINKPNIRFILHYDLPKNIEGYYQQIGRAGRDGLPAHCLLLFGYSDIQKLRYFIERMTEHEQAHAITHLQAIVGYAETEDCRREILINYFGEDYSTENCKLCDNCLEEKTPKTDVTVAAQKFLSCVKRTGEIFGASYIIDVLRGSSSAKVMSNNHHQLSTYNIGLEYNKDTWMLLARQLIQQGILVQDLRLGSLKLNANSWQVMRGQRAVRARLVSTSSRSNKLLDELNYDQILFSQLRQYRKELADNMDVPPYTIFSDKSLQEMCIYYPQTRTSMLAIHGVGDAKFEKYGDAFLDIIMHYCAQNNIQEKPKSILASNKIKKRKIEPRKYIMVSDRYNHGETIDQLKNDLNVTRNTILSHLYHFMMDGGKLRQDKDLLSLSELSEVQQKQVLFLFKELGFERLKPVYQACSEEVSYDELHILRVYYLAQAS